MFPNTMDQIDEEKLDHIIQRIEKVNSNMYETIHSDLHYKTSFLEVLGLKKLLKNAKDHYSSLFIIIT